MTTLVCDFIDIIGERIDGVASLSTGEVHPDYSNRSVKVPHPVSETVVAGQATFSSVRPGKAVLTVHWEGRSATFRFTVPNAESIALVDAVAGEGLEQSELDEFRAGIAAEFSNARDILIEAAADAEAKIDDKMLLALSQVAQAGDVFKEGIIDGSLGDYVGQGVYPVADLSVGDLPEQVYGTLVVTHPTGGRFMQEYTTYTTPVRRYVRTKHTSNADWSEWSRIDSTEKLVTSGDLNNIVEVGTYRIASTSVENRPENRYGSLEVLSPTNGRTIQRFTAFHGDAPPTTHLRSLVHVTGEWTEWAGSPYASPITEGDLNDYTYPGIVPIANLNVANIPVARSGALEVLAPTRGHTIQRYTTFEVPTRQYSRTKHASHAEWSEWYDASALTRTTGGTAGEDIAEGAARRDLLRQHLLSLKGGRIGTGGRGVVALRFDDAHTEFVERALPLLRELRLPFSRVTTTETIAAEKIDPAAFPEMEDYCIRYGGEVWNHGRTHLDATGDKNIDVEIIEPLYVLRDRMPRLNISCFAPGGGSVMRLDGHMPSKTIDNWAGTRTGRRILSHHAIATGYMDHMLIRRLDGVVRDGARQWSADNFTLAFTQSIVRQLQNGGQGACLMWHMNAAGDNFEAILRWIAAERDAGRLMVLTDSGLHCADASTSHRVNLLKTREFTGAAFSDVWTNTTGERWVERLQGYRGATVELVCDVTGTAGQTVTTDICGVEMTHTLTDGKQTIRQVATIPVDATEIRFACDGEVTQAHCWPV